MRKENEKFIYKFEIQPRRRKPFIILIILCILIGLVLKFLNIKIHPLVNDYGADFLWSMMMYFIIAFLLKRTRSRNILIISILICFSLEFLQLIETPQLLELRKDPFFRLVFGTTFLVSDLIIYFLGNVLAFIIEKLFLKRKKKFLFGDLLNRD
ncbi:DUF2809 domain-containing protein [Peptostreptococcaceae bacterium AGR-M142]